jgi:hypothetical protein
MAMTVGCRELRPQAPEDEPYQYPPELDKSCEAAYRIALKWYADLHRIAMRKDGASISRRADLLLRILSANQELLLTVDALKRYQKTPREAATGGEGEIDEVIGVEMGDIEGKGREESSEESEGEGQGEESKESKESKGESGTRMDIDSSEEGSESSNESDYEARSPRKKARYT